MFVHVKVVRSAVAALLLAAGLTVQACSSNDDPVRNPAGPSEVPAPLLVEPAEVTILVGESVQLRVIGTAAQSRAALATEWTSSDPLVAMISPEGLVTGVGLGTVQVAATRGGLHATARVSVFGRRQQSYPLPKRRMLPD